jgi:phosphatidylserine/phosphatidylglycerophosphate/cardiolipin synthase-like enzyme
MWHLAPTRIVGTRTTRIDEPTAQWFEPLPEDAASIAIASAYWDKHSCERTIALADRVGGTARLLLWTAGASRSAWVAAREQSGDVRLDLRFIDSPVDGGIVHVKVAAIEDESGAWVRTMVGSANLTAAAYERNVELGVVLDGAAAGVHLQGWFEEQFAAATPASAIDWDRAIEIAPERSEANERRKLFAAAQLASPVIVPETSHIRH